MTRPRTVHGGPRFDGLRVWRCEPRRRPPAAPAAVRLVVVGDRPGTTPMRGRLSPPYAPEQAARIANAAVFDTLRAVEAARVGPASPAWATVAGDLDQAFSWPGPSLLVGVETPQLDPRLLAESAALLSRFDAVVGPTTGDGWWAFGLREPWQVMPLSLTGTASLTLAALRLGLRVAMLPVLEEINSAGNVQTVAERCPPGSRFAATAAALNGNRAR